MYLLGFDVGSSSVKASLIEATTGKCLSTSYQPRQEMEMKALKAGWAEQDPEMWWKYLKMALSDVLLQSGADKQDVKSVGISYQMHGLVVIGKDMKVLRPSIIWCDSRAVETGEKAFENIGKTRCLESMLNSPGNFTASKLRWVRDNEPDLYRNIYKIMLPGDFIAMKMTGEINTTVSGLSEAILWDFKKNALSEMVMKEYDIDPSLIPGIVPAFAKQGALTAQAAEELNLTAGTPVAYRAGDQPNNALSLNVFNPGEIAATAGTSGVIYGVSNEVKYDPLSRVNTFAHVNHTDNDTRLGVLLCVNGTGILNSWLKKNITDSLDYEDMNKLASGVPIGSEGVAVLPFGNGAERFLGNKNIGGSILNLNFIIHQKAHLLRAAQEGIVFSLKYGIEVMENLGIKPKIIRAGYANMFLSDIFRKTLAGVTGATIELYDTDGSKGAALGGGIGAGIYKNRDEAFGNLKRLHVIEPESSREDDYKEAYMIWKKYLNDSIT